MLGDCLAVGADGAAQREVCRKGACGKVIVIAGRVELQQLERGCLGETLGREVTHDDVRLGDLVAGGVAEHGARLASHIREARVRGRCLESSALLFIERRKDKDVKGTAGHGFSSRGAILGRILRAPRIDPCVGAYRLTALQGSLEPFARDGLDQAAGTDFRARSFPYEALVRNGILDVDESTTDR